jgi:hypothetical protein
MKDWMLEYRQKKIDTILNKTMIDLGIFSLLGYTVGIGVSLFFRNRYIVRNFVAGMGGSYALALNHHSFH